MLQEVVIKTSASESLKPLLEIAIRNQLKALQHGIRRTRERVLEFEDRTGIPSVDFEKKLQDGEIEETVETIEWNMELNTLRFLEEQYQLLSEAKVN